MRYKHGFRVLDFDPKTKEFKTLFHSVNGSRVLPRGRFIEAERRVVSDGNSTKYWSGFHVFTDLENCLKYAKRFGKRTQRVVVNIHFTGNRIKEHSKSGVILADRMRIPKFPAVNNTLASVLHLV